MDRDSWVPFSSLFQELVLNDSFDFYFLSFETFALITLHITNSMAFTICVASVMSSSV